MKVEVQGTRQLVRSLEKLGVSVGDLKQAFKKAGQLVATNAAHAAPYRTGRLSRSLRASNTKNKALIRAGSARVPYAGVQEYGWRAHNIQGTYFLNRTVQKDRPEAIRIIDEEVKTLVRRYGLK